MKKNLREIYDRSYAAAVIFHRLGFKLFPVTINKRPLHKGWQTLNINPVEYRKKHGKNVLWAMHLNQGFWIMDVDLYSEAYKKSKKAQEIYKSIKNPRAIMQYTQNGGEHFYFKGNFKNTTSKLAPGIDTKGENGYGILYMDSTYAMGVNTKEEFINALPTFVTKDYNEKRKLKIIKNEKDSPIQKLDLLERLEKHFDEKLFQKGKRNSDLYKTAHHLIDTGQGELLLELAQIANSKGLTEKEIELTIQSAKKKRAENKKDTIQLIRIQKDQIFKKPESFGKLFLHHGFNIVAGPTKTGKSRACLTYIATEIKKEEYKGKKALVVSTENPPEMIGPYIQSIEATDQIIIGDPVSMNCDISLRTEMKLTYPHEKIGELIYRVEQTLIDYQWEVLFLDPMPRFMDWNNEQYIVRIFETFSKLGQKYKCCIIGVRNDGKTKDYSEEHKAKGSSASADVIRMGIRAITAHPKSFFGKQFGKNKAFILTNQYLNSMLPDHAELYQLQIINFKGHEIAIATKEQEFSNNYEIKSLKHHCQQQSGYSTPGLILNLIKNRRMTRQEIIEELPFTKKGTIYQAIDRLLKSKEIREVELKEDGIIENLLAINKGKR